MIHLLFTCFMTLLYKSEHIVPKGTQIHYTEVPVGTTGLILILQNLYLYYQYGSTRRYYKDFTCTKVPVGSTQVHYTEVPIGTYWTYTYITELILILPIQKYP